MSASSPEAHYVAIQREKLLSQGIFPNLLESSYDSTQEVATVRRFLMRLSEAGLSISKLKPGTGGDGMSHVVFTEKVRAQCV